MRIGSHEWKGDGRYCESCGASMHCAACSDSSGDQGHHAIDAEGGFFTCQDAERAERWRTAFLKKLAKP